MNSVWVSVSLAAVFEYDDVAPGCQVVFFYLLGICVVSLVTIFPCGCRVLLEHCNVVNTAVNVRTRSNLRVKYGEVGKKSEAQWFESVARNI